MQILRFFINRSFCCFLAGVLATVSLAATQSPPAENNPIITRRLQGFVDDGTFAGAVTLVARRDRILSIDTAGYADLMARHPMRSDTLFWIASMTKPITAVAVLILQEEGRLNIEDPVEKYLPEFKGQWLVSEMNADMLKLVRPARLITLRDLLTHTSGMGEIPEAPYDCSLAELVRAAAREPLLFPPGSQWKYSNAGINTLGRIIEVVTGQKYEDFLQQRIFIPLGMTDTTFWPTNAQAVRIAKSYRPGKDGSGLRETGVYFFKGAAITDRTRTPLPAAGLFSTVRDIARFYQMALNGGTLDDVRIISPKALDLMTRIHTGDYPVGFTEGMAWGLGFQVVKEPQGITGALSPGTFGHDGAYGTQNWADPQRNLIFVLLMQCSGFPNKNNSQIRQAFQEDAVAAYGK